MSKYGNVKTMVFGQVFDSKREATRYMTLRALQDEGKISDLKTQVNFPIVLNGVKICDYRADFVYFNQQGAQVIEDAKGYKTDVYRLKKKLVRACYGVVILES